MKKNLAIRSKDEIKSISKTTTDKHELRRLDTFLIERIILITSITTY